MEAIASELGLHPYEYQALADDHGNPLQNPMLILQRNERQWSQTFTSPDLSSVSDPVMEFFRGTFKEMAQVMEHEYREFLNERKV
jgi:hypothetical protein